MSDSSSADVPGPSEPPDRERGSVTVLGTAHVSQESVEEVHETVDREQPDVVAVELDEGRYRQMRGDTPDDVEARDLLSGNTVFQFLAYWMLSYVQSRLGDQFDIEPGADMRAGIEAAQRNESDVALVDRDIQVTMQRFWTRLSLAEKLKMVGGLALGITDPRTIGLALGAGVGIFAGVVFAAFVAPAVGLGETLALGITDPTALRYAGAVGLGAIGGLVVGLVVIPPLEDVERYTAGLFGGFTARLLGGVAVGIAACLALVASGTFVGPLSAGTFEGAGTTAIRGTVGILAGLGIGVVVGGAIGLVVDALTADVESVDEIDLEEITDGDVVRAMMEEFRQFSPGGANALIDERDAYIAHELDALRERGYHVVAVVGAGHQAGIESYLADPDSLPSLESITGTASSRRFSPLKVVSYLFVVGFVAFFFLLLMAGVQNTLLLQLFVAWVAFNGVLTFTLARLAGAHWSSAGVGGGVAWMTSLNPMLAPGWFAGYVELKHRPVNVSDIQTLNEIVDDTERPLGDALSDMFDVPLFRLIMIVALTNVGSIIGTFLFGFVVLPWFGTEIGGVSELMGALLDGARNSLDLIWGIVR